MADRIGRAAAVTAALVAVTSCTGPTGSSERSPSPGLPTVAVVTAPPLVSPCSPTHGPAIHLKAVRLTFDPDCVAAVARRPLRLVFDNQDEGVRHNVAIFPGPRGYSTNPPYLFQGRFITGRSEDRETIPPLPAGLLHFHCDLHPDVMQGLFAVAPTAKIVGDSIRVRWATKRSAPRGYVFDVQFKGPADRDFTDWLRHVNRFGASLEPDAPGRYTFRVSIYPGSGDMRPLGYSPTALVDWGSE
jgi:hypothetical protein